jgi:hypothetical protein
MTLPDIGGPSSRVVPVLLSAAAFSLKLSALPLVVCSLLFYFRWATPRRRLAGLFGLSAFFVVPTILANLTASGCPLFPSSFLCTRISARIRCDTSGLPRSRGLRPVGTPPRDAHTADPSCGRVRWTDH